MQGDTVEARRGNRSHCGESALVVGAGFSGLMVAYRLVLSGQRTCLVDVTNDSGGVMRDDFIGGSPHLSGCHLIQAHMPEAFGFALPFHRELVSTSNKVSSWTQSGGLITRQKGVEGPTTSGDPNEWVPSETLSSGVREESVADRLSRYPLKLQKQFGSWVSPLGLNLETTAGESLEALQMKRVFYGPEYHDSLVQIKSRDPIADDMLGVAPDQPREVLIARKGYSSWFDGALEELRALGVCFHPNSAARPFLRGQKMHLRLRDETISPPMGFWCANPTPLVKALFPGRRLDGPSQLLSAWHVDVKQVDDPTFAYVQFFGHPAGVTRGTKYVFDGVQRVVVESIASTRTEIGKAQTTILDAAREVGVQPQTVTGPFTRRAYLTVSISDLALLQELGGELANVGWGHSGLHFFSRPKKLSWLSQEFSRYGFPASGAATSR